MNYTNPIISGFYPDPSICRVEDDFYMVTSTFEYFPGVPIFHSKDLVNWKQIGHCLTTKEQLPLEKTGSSGGVFAPTIRYHNGRFYMITTNVSHKGNFFVWAEKPEGPWSDPVWLNEWPGIDPSLFFDDDGTVYITGTREGVHVPHGIYQATLDIETGKLLSDRQLIWEGTGAAEPEGPHLYKVDEYYYLLISEGGTEYGHMVVAARSKTPFGPFESYEGNPILSHRSLKSPIQGTGHSDLIQFTDGSWWAVFLAYRPIGYFPKHHLGRETFLAPVQWTEEGWPIFGDNGKVTVEMEAPHLDTPQSTDWEELDDFNKDSLGMKWNYRRNPIESNYSLTNKEGWLSLKGAAATLSETEAHTFIGRRQEHFDCAVSTLLSFDPDEGEEAGLTVYANEQYHYDVALMKENGQKCVIFRKTVGSLCLIEKRLPYTDEEITLKVKADDTTYTFSFTDSSGKATDLGIGECGFLSKEVAGGFTGVYFGLYATGNGKESANDASFDWFKYSI